MTDLCIQEENPRILRRLAITNTLRKEQMQEERFTRGSLTLYQQGAHPDIVDHTPQALL